jgi:perosamine synthetase
MLVERREDFIRKLASCSIPASVVHLRIDRNSVFGGMRDDLPGQTAFNESQVSLPIHEALGTTEMQSIVNAVRAGW